MSRGPGRIQKKVMLLLQAGFALSFVYSPKHRKRIYKALAKELKGIDEDALQNSIKSLYQNKLINIQEGAENIISITLSDNGKKKVLSYDIEKMRINTPRHWDKRWRIVVFDIPHSIKKIRDSLRGHLKNLGFYELQKSVFVFPYDCQSEIDFLIEFYSIRSHVRQIKADQIDNELHLKKIFKLL